MNLGKLRISRRTVTIAAAFVGMVSLAIGAHAALNKRSLDAAKAIGDRTDRLDRHHGLPRCARDRQRPLPRRAAPLSQPINDARGLTAALRAKGFDVDVVEDATKDDMARAIVRLKAKIKQDTVVMLFFGGYGVQVGRESFMIPVDAAIWKEADVRRDGVSIEQVLDVMTEQGAKAKLVVVDASRRNPYERRFRSYLPRPRPDRHAGQRADPDLGDAGQGGRRRQGPVQRAGDRAPQQSAIRNVRRRKRLQQDPHRRLPRLRRRAGAAVSSSLLEDVQHRRVS